MRKLVKDIISELKTMISGSTIDAIIPPIVFVMVNAKQTLGLALSFSLFLSVGLFVYRMVKGEKWIYAIGGLLGVLVATVFAFFFGGAKDYFLPDIISGGFSLILCLLSLIIKKPLAAWVSHLTRGWPIQWFMREDVRPAYMEVTIFWTCFLVLRLLVLIVVYLEGDPIMLLLSNILLGFPAIIVILIITYIYGIWRLRKLKGPGVDEFIEKLSPPWKGQKKGF